MVQRHLRSLVLLFSVFLTAIAVWSNINVGRYDSVHIVPAPGTVAIDGLLTDWDTSGEFFTYRFDDQKDKYAFRGYMMYDAQNLYLAAHVVDSSPMMNMYNPDAEATVAWRGDCLQVRLSTDPQLGWPLPSNSASDRIAHLTMWYYTPKALPCLMLQYGMDYHGQTINPAGYHGAYQKDADGKGYVLEYAIPWELLHSAQNPPKGGDVCACIWQKLWSDEQGRNYKVDLSEIRNPSDSSLAYQSASGWGRAVYEKAGHLPAGTVVAREEARAAKTDNRFYSINYVLPGKEQARVGMQIYDSKGHTVRWLLGDAERSPGKNVERWNGLDDDGNPVPPGKYTVKWCYHHVKGKMLAAANNPGNPPYNSGDNHGSWAGDYGWPTGITANDTHLFLTHLTGEASRPLIKITPQGQRLWGVDPTLDLGPHLIDICNDGKYLYILYGDFRGGKCPTGGFVKLNCDNGYNDAIGTTGRSFLVMTNPEANNGIGTTKDVSAIATNADTVFVASEQDGKIFCIEKSTGKQVRVIENVEKPHGLAIGPNGRLYVVADKSVLSMQPDGSERNTVIPWYEIATPRRLTVAKNGDLFVTVQGISHQVLHFDAQGKFINAIGRQGGMMVPGPWVKEAMLRPLGVCIAPDGNVWVTEDRMNPKRTSVWKQDGAFVAEYCGPVPYAGTCVMDGDDPEHIYSENTQFQIDYATGKTWPSAVVYDDGEHGQVGPLYGSWEARFIHFKGRTFLMRAGGNLYEMVKGRFVPRVTVTQLPGITHNPYWVNNLLIGIDRNEDGKIDPGETQPGPVSGGNGWMAWFADNLDIYCGDWQGLWKLPFEGFDQHGVPIYRMEHCTLLLTTQQDQLAKHPGARLFPTPGNPDTWMTDAQGNIYLVMNGGQDRIKRGQPYLDKGHRLVKLSPDLQVLWEYRNVVVGMGAAWNTTISKPGEILGTMRMTNIFGHYLTLATYYGQYHILDTETGLYITSLTPDTRSEPPLNEMAVFTENFNGCAVYAPKLHKYLYCGGDAQARVWEVQGLADVKYASFPITVTAEDHTQAVAANKVEYGVANVEKATSVYMAKSFPITLDGDLTEWQNADWLTFSVDDKRQGRAAVCWSGNSLNVAFDITDESPMLNRGGNNNLIFKSGDCLEFDLSSAPEDIERKDEQPLPGDKRILMTFTKDAQGNERPLVMLYEPKSDRKEKTPGTFVSPVSTVIYEHVAPLPANIAIKRTATGYTVEAQFDSKQLGFTSLEVGQHIRADVGALFSDKGGNMVLAKTMWADDSPEVSVVNDVPTESRIHPKHWGWLVLR